MRVLLINPNTSADTSAAMLAIAQGSAPTGVTVTAATAPFGSPLIVDAAMLAVASEAVTEMVRRLADPALDGVIVSAFGDPGLAPARGHLACPVTGIAEAGMAEAAEGGRSFAVATTTPGLVEAIGAAARRYGHADRFRGVWLTPGDPTLLMASPSRLEDALEEAVRDAMAAGAEAVVIGGGPLATAARAVARRVAVPVIEPIPAAVRLALRRAEAWRNAGAARA